MDKKVYLHRKKTNGEVFYVGIGNSARPYQMSKNEETKYWWNVFEKYGCEVEIIHEDLSYEEACLIEADLVEKHKDTITNLVPGGIKNAAFGNGSAKKEVVDLQTGIFYDSLKEACEATGTDYMQQRNARSKNLKTLKFN